MRGCTQSSNTTTGQPEPQTPDQEEPRERLLRHGAQVLSDAELLAVLLRPSRRGASVLHLARELLTANDGLPGLVGADPRALRRKGLGTVSLSAVLAAFELCCRLAHAQLPERAPMTRPEDVARYLCLRYGRNDQEVVGALFLDTRNRLIREREVFRGTLNRAAVEPRGVLKEAVLQGAAAVVLFHTHPSGDPSPSREDLLFSRQLFLAGETLGIPLLDHLIIGSPQRWTSLRERGWR